MLDLIDRTRLVKALNKHLTSIKKDETTDYVLIETYEAVIKYIETEPSVEEGKIHA